LSNFKRTRREGIKHKFYIYPLGAADHGAEVNVKFTMYVVYHVVNLGAVARGTEALYLGATVHGAELGVHFLKSFQKERTCENLSQKGIKCKKTGLFIPMNMWKTIQTYDKLASQT
jgi:hypothetical protein